MAMTKGKQPRCAGCGHPLSRHTEYARGGTNRIGCRLVCTVDGCQDWGECRLESAPETPKGEEA